jgi:acetyltransferase
MTDPVKAAECLTPYAKGLGKPVLASWMGGLGVAAGEAVLNAAGIPTFAFPDTAARAFNYLWRYSYNLRGLYQTPALSEVEVDSAACQEVHELINRARGSGRTLLAEAESKQLLTLYGIPTVETRVATSEPEAVSLAREIGFPVVLKLHSETITHKAEVGGVKLDLADEGAVRRAYREIQLSVSQQAGAEHFLGVSVQPMIRQDGYELIVGSTLDEQFGPVILFGAGGPLVEIFQDRALALPPLNTTLARRLMEQTRIFKALQGVRGRKPVDLAALEELLVRFSQLVIEQRGIREMDINPLLATSDGFLALDARVVLHARKVRDEDIPRPVIRPYPTQYISSWTMKDGAEVLIRPIRPEDEPLMVKFHQTLSERTVYLRYFQLSPLSQRTAHERLIRICFIDYDREMALVAERREPSGEREIAGVGRLTKVHGRNEAEVAVLVSDRYQRRGIGTELLRRLTQVGRDEKLDRLVAYMLPENQEVLKVFRVLGFKARREPGEPLLAASLEF